MGMGGGKKGMDGNGKLRPGIKRWDTIIHVSCSMTLKARNGLFISNEKTHSKQVSSIK